MKKNSEMGKRIEALRKAHGMSQADLAGYLGVSRASVSAWETGAAIPGEVWVKLTALMRDHADIVRALDAAGLTPRAILDAAQVLQKSSVVRPKRGEDFLIAALAGATEGQIDDIEREFQSDLDEAMKHCRIQPTGSLRIPAEFALDPVSTRFYIVNPRSAGFGLEVGDVLLLNISEADALSLLPFWDEVVMLRQGVEEIVGWLTLEESVWPGNVSSYTANIEAWTAHHRITRESLPEGIHYQVHAHRLQTWKPTVRRPPLIVGQWQGESSGSAHLGDDFSSLMSAALKRARSELRLFQGYRMVGRVIGWFRPPSKSGKLQG